jgi:hypothetical protein
VRPLAELVILAGSWKAAKAWADRRGIDERSWIWPTVVGRLRTLPNARVVVDLSTFGGHPEYPALAEWFAWRSDPDRRPGEGFVLGRAPMS